LLPAVAPLTAYAVKLRYDDGETVAKEARSSALAVFEFVLDRLPIDIRKSAE